MPTLAQRLPYLHPFAGGYPYRGSQRLPSDPDALTYLAAVAAADGAPVEVGVATAVDDFFRGMKADGTFGALKAACLLCGARTLAGALVPIVGAAPTNNNFVDADYNRGTGLKGNGSTKYLDSNRANNADGQDDSHMAVYATAANTADPGVMMGSGRFAFTGTDQIANATASSPTGLIVFSRLSTTSAFDVVAGAINSAGFQGISRSEAAGYDARVNGATTAITRSSSAPVSDNVFVFDRNPQGAGAAPTDARIAFYSIGESISDLALLDARVTALVQRIQLSLSTGLDASGYDDATVAYLLAAYNNGATLE
jgi:hypothetical protein